jgi:nucleotide-binding universal stress UspA family protein
MSYDRILVATDDSEPARRATSEALTLAETFDATLHALYVLKAAEPPPWFDDPAAEPGTDTEAGVALNAVVSEAAERDFGSETVTAVVDGQTAPAILEYAAEHDVDLIVLGTHGCSGIDRLLLGSVAEAVVRESPVPVVTVGSDT